MENENEQIQEEEELDLPEVAEGEEDTTDWKELALKQQGINKRLKTKMEKAKEAKEENVEEKPSPEKPEENKKPTSDFNYGEKAFLKSYGIEGADERELVKAIMLRTGDDLDKVIGDDILQAKLEKLREAKAIKEAIPTRTNRSASNPTNAVDFYLDKPFSEVPKELKRDVLNAKLKKDEQSAKFGN